MIELNEQNGLWWPTWEDRQQIHYEYHTKHLKDADYIIKNAKQRRLIFQAGGNVGIWPNYFARFFDNVITAEADPDLYTCLEKNKSVPHIRSINGAVGNGDEDLNFFRTGKSGTGTVCGDGSPDFKVKQFTIDSLELQELDAIYLDIEGYEETALRGATETLKRCRPLVCAETFDRTREAINALMGTFDYVFVRRFGRDQVYAPK